MNQTNRMKMSLRELRLRYLPRLCLYSLLEMVDNKVITRKEMWELEKDREVLFLSQLMSQMRSKSKSSWGLTDTSKMHIRF